MIIIKSIGHLIDHMLNTRDIVYYPEMQSICCRGYSSTSMDANESEKVNHKGQCSQKETSG